MPIRSFDISGAMLQDLFTMQEENPALWRMVQEQLGPASQCPAVIMLPGLFPCFVPEDLEQEAYGQSIDAGATVQMMQEDELTGRLRLLAIYFQPAFDATEYNSDRVADAELLLRWLPADQAIGISNHFLNELGRINAAMADSLHNIPYSKDEERAGIKELEKYGPFTTLHNLAKSNGQTVEWWCRQPWVYVNTYLRMENDKAFIQHKLNKLLNPQNA